jgi:hypothetical protein
MAIHLLDDFRNILATHILARLSYGKNMGGQEYLAGHTVHWCFAL